MSIVDLAKFLTGLTLGFVFKILVILSLGLYLIFALILVKQVDLMGKTVKNPLTPFLILLALLHALAALLVLIVALTIL